MFQSSDDFDLDQVFSDEPFVLDTPSTSNHLPPVKKFCPREKEPSGFVFAVPSTSKSKENIFEILSKKANKPFIDEKSEKEPSGFVFAVPSTSKSKENIFEILSKKANKPFIDEKSEKEPSGFAFAVPSTSKSKENILEILSKKPNKPVCQIVRFGGVGSPNRSGRNVQRKFPGPAGLLPEKRIKINVQALENCDSNEKNKTETPEEMPSSQLSENCFKGTLWKQMCKDYYIDDVKLYLPERFSISWLKTMSMSRELRGQKTPFLAAIIKSIDYTVKNPIVILKDPTGEIPGTLHHEALQEFSENIHVGCVIVLRQVGILSTHRKRYVNITRNNVIIVYSYKDYNKDLYRICQSQTQKNLQMEVLRLQDIPCSEILNSIEDFERSCNENSIVENDNPFLSNITFSNNNSRVQNNSFADKSILNEFSNNLNLFIEKENSVNISEIPTNNLFSKQMINKQNIIHDSETKDNFPIQNKQNSGIISATDTEKSIYNSVFANRKFPQNPNINIRKNFPVLENQNSEISATETKKSIYNSVFSNNVPQKPNINFQKNFPVLENQNSGIISATDSETDYNSVLNKLNENIGFSKNQENSHTNFPISENQNSDIISATESVPDYNNVFNKLNENSYMNFHKNFPISKNPNSDIISGTANENFVFSNVFNKLNIQNSVLQKNVSEKISRTQNSDVISASVVENNVYNQIFMPKKNSSCSKNVSNEQKIHENPSSGTKTQNLMHLIFKNKPTSSEKNSSVQNYSNDFDITFELDDSQNNMFLTSTQNPNFDKNKYQNMFQDSENLLDGLEDSFLEEF